jgi:hypothetical protein
LLLLSSFETAVCAHASRCFFFAHRERDREAGRQGDRVV